MSEATLTIPKQRIESLDTLRGFVILLMALDHTRDFFHVDAFRFDPSDIHQTTLPLFFTRWVTHLCAPLFLLLAGIAIKLYQEHHTPKQTSRYLVSRGLWLIVLELTVIQFAWRFAIDVHHITGLVIWVIGWSMVFMAALIYLSPKMIAGLSLMLIVGHNLFDNLSFNGTLANALWAFLHVNTKVALSDTFYLRILYPLIPALAVMMLGYIVGIWYTPSCTKEKRKTYLITIGVILCIAFVVFRTLNLYGDPVSFSVQESTSQTIFSFFSISKYPFSLHYLMATLGIGFLLLYIFEYFPQRGYGILSTLGKASLFFYILHLFFFHSLAGIAYTIQTKGEIKTLDPMALSDMNYGYSLPVVYLVWMGGCVVLYYACRHYIRYKKQHHNMITRWI